MVVMAAVVVQVHKAVQAVPEETVLRVILEEQADHHSRLMQ
jgi:hypothetical protein